MNYIHIGAVIGGIFLFVVLLGVMLGVKEHADEICWAIGNKFRQRTCRLGWKFERARYQKKFQKQQDEIRELKRLLVLETQRREQEIDRFYGLKNQLRIWLNHHRENRGKKPLLQLNRKLNKFLTGNEYE